MEKCLVYTIQDRTHINDFSTYISFFLFSEKFLPPNIREAKKGMPHMEK